jgi:hypothetical protein
VLQWWFPIEVRNNEEWLAALRGPEKEAALADLRGLLVRGLRAALHGRVGGVEPSVEDFAQEALLKILDNLDSFRGRAASRSGRRRSACARRSPRCDAAGGATSRWKK